MSNSSVAAFGVLLRQHRRAAGLTQESLAERAGLSVNGIQKLERGVTHPYRDTAQRLVEALQLEPDDQTRLQAAVDPVRRHGSVQPPPPREAPTGALPVQVTSFVGRERELVAVADRLSGARLLTLTGPGGVGKTRLALEVASGLIGASSYGVCLVTLAPLAQPELVVQAVAHALGMRIELDRQPEAALNRFLAERRVLLILDNCEHLLDACAALVEPVLERCAGVRVLATSREPLGLDGEMIWRLEPLDEAAATRLFVERARAQHAAFDASDGASIAHVCRQLDHLPLAIELAAARMRLLGPAEILPLLRDRFSLLKRPGGRGGSLRQQTLQATVDWSYGLLSAHEQQLFRRLAVFAGPFDLAAANAMGGPNSLETLGRLVDKSLVVAEPTNQGSRYHLLETLRHYAWDRLREMGEVELARQRHLDHFLGQAEALFTPLESIDGPTRALDAELDNLRSAMDWCQLANPSAGLRLLATTGYVWWRRSHAEGRRWAEIFLARCPQPSPARAQGLHAAGMLEFYANPGTARRLLSESLELAEMFGDRVMAAVAGCDLGFAAYLDEDLSASSRHLERSLAIVEELGSPVAIGRVLTNLAVICLTEPARREEARRLAERARALGDQAGDQFVQGASDIIFGYYWRRTGQPTRALGHFFEALGAFQRVGDITFQASVMLDIARLLAASDPVRAARLAGASLELAEQAGARFRPRVLRGVDRLRTELSDRLGNEQARWMWAEGERLSAAEAVALAEDARQNTRAAADGLSPRETEVAELVARGLTSRQVADALQVSTRTVDTHLARIFTKLGLTNRLQLATWMMRATDERRLNQ